MNNYKRKKGKYNGLPQDEKSLLELVKLQWEEFKKINGSYPTAQEIDSSNSMVPCRTIQRKLGSLKSVREKLGYPVTNFSTGTQRSDTIKESLARSMYAEAEVFNYVYNYFGKRPKVYKNEYYSDELLIQSDIGVYHKHGHFYVDTFYANDLYSLRGCINNKQAKLKDLNIKDIIYFVSTNPDISQHAIDLLVLSKNNKLPNTIIVLTTENFKMECNKFTPL